MKILIVEDDPIWQTKLQEILQNLGMNNLEFCNDIESFQASMTISQPEVIITDVFLGDQVIFDFLNDSTFQHIPILFITNSEQVELYERSKLIPIRSYLIKPFHAISLKAALDNIFKPQHEGISQQFPGIEVKGIHNEKIILQSSQIVFIRSEWNYCFIKTPNNQFLYRASMDKIQALLGDDMIRVHRSYFVNKNNITKISLSKMEISTTHNVIPIGRKYKENILEYMAKNRKL